MAHSLPALEFSSDALNPHISAETLSIHHGKHHQAYVTNLNKLIEGSEFASASLEELVRESSGVVFNNAAQHFNHSFYWKGLSESGGGEPSGALAEAIRSSFGSFGAFREEFSRQAGTLFGSGWCWLVKDGSGALSIVQTFNAGCPLTEGLVPLLTCDVWEHAYYVDYRHRRADYIEAFWSLVNWDFVARNLA